MNRSWSLKRAEVLVRLLNERGLTLPVDTAVELIEDRVQAVATGLSITPKSARSYLDDERLAGLADSIVEMLADEDPGEDLVDAIRDCPVPVAVAARTITALSEAGRVRLPSGGYEAADDALGLVSLWGHLLLEGNRDGGRVIVKTCGSACHATFCWRPDSSGRSTSLPRSKVAPARTRATRCGALTARQRRCADSMSLNAIAMPAAREPGPLVTR